jgi:hypothetical protein
MSEKRKPNSTFLLKKQGNRSVKIEIFNGSQWSCSNAHELKFQRRIYRVRVNGKWRTGTECGNKFITIWELKSFLSDIAERCLKNTLTY